MKNRFELIRWINERCPQNKIHSIEQLSDGKHFLKLLHNIYPSIQMDRIQDGSNLINRLNNIQMLSDQVKLLGLDIKIEVSKIAYKNISSIIKLLQQFQQFIEDTERQEQQREVSFQEPIEEITINSQPQHIQNEEQEQVLEQFNLQYENLKMDLKQLLLSQLPHPIIYEKLVEILIKYDNSDQQIIDLQNQLKSQIEEEQQYQMTYNNRTSKYTHYDSLKSSQFYNQEPYLSGSQFSFSQQGTQSKTYSDSLFFVSEIKRL